MKIWYRNLLYAFIASWCYMVWLFGPVVIHISVFLFMIVSAAVLIASLIEGVWRKKNA